MYNFRISYIKGIENTRVDALSGKLEYLNNKKYKSRVILRIEEDLLVFNT